MTEPEPEIHTADEAEAAIEELGAWLLAGWDDRHDDALEVARGRIAGVAERIRECVVRSWLTAGTLHLVLRPVSPTASPAENSKTLFCAVRQLVRHFLAHAPPSLLEEYGDEPIALILSPQIPGLPRSEGVTLRRRLLGKPDQPPPFVLLEAPPSPSPIIVPDGN